MIITHLLLWNFWTQGLLSLLTVFVVSESFPANQHDVQVGARLEPDLSLLQPRRQDDQDPDVTGAPYVALFEKDGKQLLFLAAKHEKDIENAPTHELVRKAIDWLEPDVVIIEGVRTSEGPNPQRFLGNARRRVESGSAPESLYAAVLGIDSGAIVIGGEPDPEATTDVIHEAGYSDSDLLGFLLARRMVQMVRNQDLTRDEFDSQANKALRFLKRKFKIRSDFDANDFLNWYKRNLGEKFKARKIRSEVNPMLVDEPTILRKMAILAMKAREYNLAELEARMLQEHDRVLVVYGSGHLRWERRMLEDMMGLPVLVSQNPGSPQSPEELERLRGAWTRKVTEEPRYFINDGYGEQAMESVRSGIDVTRDYLGNYGPTQVFIVGQQADELDEPQSVEEIARAFCEVHTANSDRPIEDCISHEGMELASKARDGEEEAYLTMAMESDPPTAELVFINTHGWGEENLPTRGIHEYTHVYQKAFDFTPTWMMEGGAEFLACHLGEKNGWGNLQETMSHYARQLERAEDLKYTIRDMEDIETAKPAVKKWHRELAYDAGAWAVVYVIKRSRSRSVHDYFLNFYPAVDEEGWEAVILEYTGHQNLDAFYSGFEGFMELPLDERIKILEMIKD